MHRKIHLYTGIAVVVIFVLTGQYMHHVYGHLKEMEPMSRALFRAGHIYILFCGLVHIAMGASGSSTSPLGRRARQAGSFLTLIATAAIISAFFLELPAEDIERPLTRWGIYGMLAGVSFHGISSFLK